MTIEILCAVPELLASPFEHSIMKRAQERGLLNIKVHDLRKWAINKHGQIDDYQYGGGAGMLIMCEPLANAIDELQAAEKFDEIIFVTPDGKRFESHHRRSPRKPHAGFALPHRLCRRPAAGRSDRPDARGRSGSGA